VRSVLHAALLIAAADQIDRWNFFQPIRKTFENGSVPEKPGQYACVLGCPKVLRDIKDIQGAGTVLV
jgi:hypothetical protein